MWTRVVRVLTAGLMLVGVVAAVGVGGAEASHPGNNGRLVYVGASPGAESGTEIFTMNLDGSDVRQLTFDGGQLPWIWISEEHRVLSSNISPAWSPSGTM